MWRLYHLLGFPSGSVVKNLPIIQELQETQVPSLGQKNPLEKGMATHSSTLPGESHELRRLAGNSPWGLQEADKTEVTEHTCTIIL